MKLSKAQQRVLGWLADQEEAGTAPSFQEAAEELDYASPSAVHRLIGVLADKGLIEKALHLHACQLTRAGWEVLGRAAPSDGIPVIGAIAAGSPILASENLDGHLPDLQPRSQRFALRVRGDSMIDAGIHDGDHAIIDGDKEVRDGDIAAVLVEEEATLKRLRFSSLGLTLEAANPAIPDRELRRGRDEWRILGGLHAVIRAID